MPLIKYQTHNFRKQSRLIIEIANNIIAEYQADGYDLTLRQLYYQFVARGHIANSQREYNKLGVIVNKARLAGLIDWETIVDRTRPVQGNNHFKDPAEILSIAAEQFRIDTRLNQNIYIEVWVEKEALLGVIERVCSELDVTYLACRGYFSQSAMWWAARRIQAAQRDGKQVVILHLGDHDPSGLDMTRDIKARLQMLSGGVGATSIEVERLALNMEQIEKYKPPPNFAKLTDTRCKEYIAEYGRESWELDALDPKVITGLIEDAASQYTDEEKQQTVIDVQEEGREKLQHIADNWQEIGE